MKTSEIPKFSYIIKCKKTILVSLYRFSLLNYINKF